MKKFRAFCLSFSILFFQVACGLDTIVYLEPPVATRVQTSTQDYEQYLSFTTADEINSLDGFYNGFTVFYRIYATQETLNAEVKNIENYNSNSKYNAVNYIKNLKYQELQRQDGQNPLIPKASTNRKILIRLFDYGTEKKGLYIDDSLASPEVLRNTTENSSFKKLPYTEEATDIAPQAQGQNAEYQYVAFFACTTGFDTNFVTLYSGLVYLGFLMLQ